MSTRARALFATWVERLIVDGERLDPKDLGDEATADELQRLIDEYDALQETLVAPVTANTREPACLKLPRFDGFRTIEHLGSGGSGDVYKLEDLELGRQVAAKVLRPSSDLHQGLEGFLREARSLALFDDPRIVRVLEFRKQSDPPALLMEYVDGFPLDRIVSSLEFRQRARLLIDVAEAIEHAHRAGIQHRDLKPANVLVDADLRPRILDFGLADRAADRGHGLGTPAYMAPEQLDTTRDIDARTDVYALGVMLYQVLCGRQPYHATNTTDWIRIIREGRPALPLEVAPDVPEPLQAIALKAMETAPDRRYASAQEFATDLRRWIEGRPVTARPSIYQDALSRRIQPHLEQIREWTRLKLLFPHEATALEEQYRSLEVREEEWILRSRDLSLSQIALYLGAAVLFSGSLFYYATYLNAEGPGWFGPLMLLALPFVGINLFARRLDRSGRPAVAVAYHLAAVLLLPLYLLTLLDQLNWWPSLGDEFELATDWISNRRLQSVTVVTAVWGAALAVMTRTLTFGAYTMVWTAATFLALLADFGLRGWVLEDRWDRLGLRLAILAGLYIVGGLSADRTRLEWFARPAYVAAALTIGLALELIALDGRAMQRLGISLEPLMANAEGDPVLLNTLVAMAAFGVLFYALGRAAEIVGSATMSSAARLLCAIAPFAILQPLSIVSATALYPIRFTWMYLALALAVTLLSRLRQRKAFYYAGVGNTVIALFFLTRDYGWWDRVSWAISVLVVGLVLLVVGYLLHRREQPSPTRRS